MRIVRLKISTLAALATLAVTAAHAADMPLPPPQAEPCCSNWYLRGFVGSGMTDKFKLDYLENPAHTTGFVFDQNSNSDTSFIGGGVGYNFNSWLRFDGTAEYRGRTQVNARGVYNPAGDGDAYQGYIKSWVFLANAYVDLGTWNCFTPYVGVGVGGAYNQLADFVDMGIGTTGAGFGRNSTNWSLAWALHAGVAYDISKSSQGRALLPLSELRLCHRYGRLHRRLHPRLLQVQQPAIARHHARPALDLLRCGGAAALRLYAAAAAAAEQPRLIENIPSAPFG